MASRYWVGGAATWDATAGTKWATTSGGVGGAAVPVAGDDVFFDVLSVLATVTISGTTTCVCRSINCTGFTGTISHPAATTITIGDGTAGAGSVALLFVAGMTYTVGSVTTSTISYVSTSATVQSITTGGKTMCTSTWNGVGGSWQFADNYSTGGTANSSMTLTNGTLDTNGKTVTVPAFDSNNSNVRTLTLGASVFNCTGVSVTTGWNILTGTNLTLNAGTSSIVVSGANTFAGGSKAYYDISMTNSIATVFNLGGVTSCHNLTFTPGNIQQHTTSITAAITVSNLLTVTSFSSTIRTLLSSGINLIGTPTVITAASVSFTNVDFMDITGAGAASPFTGTSMGDAQGNSGITFDAPATQTFDGTAGSWATAARWTSRVPLPQDDVVINGASGNITATGMLRLGKNINFTGYTGTITRTTNNTAYSFYGSMTLSAGMSMGATPALFGMIGRGRSAYTITSAGQTFFPASTTGNFQVLAPGGTYTLADAFLKNSPTNPTSVDMGAGTFDASTFGVTVDSITSSGTFTRVLATGSGTWTLNALSSNLINFAGSGLTVTGTAVWLVALASASTRFVTGNNTAGLPTLTYTIAGSTGKLSILGNNSFDTLNFSDASNARTLEFAAGGGGNTFRKAFNVRGFAGNLVTIQSSTAAVHNLTLTAREGPVDQCDYLSITNSNAVNGPWYAGNNSTNVSGNTGWIFSIRPPPSSLLTLGL